MKAKLVQLMTYVRARLSEPSTHAGIAAFLAAAGSGLAAVGSPRAAIGLLATAALAGLKAAMTSDPQLAAEVKQAIAVESVAGPVAASLAAAVLPQQAARIAALEVQVAAIAPKLEAGGQ